MGRIPAAYTLHELTHLIGAFTWHKRPVGSPTVDFIEEKKVKLPSGLLLLSQYQLFGCGLSATTIGFDRNDFHIKEQQDALLWPMPPNHAQAAENRAALGILAEQFTLNATSSKPPFLSTRRKCSLLMLDTILYLIR